MTIDLEELDVRDLAALAAFNGRMSRGQMPWVAAREAYHDADYFVKERRARQALNTGDQS